MNSGMEDANDDAKIRVAPLPEPPTQPNDDDDDDTEGHLQAPRLPDGEGDEWRPQSQA